MDIANRVLGDLYFVTSTVVDWVDIFTRPARLQEVLDYLYFSARNYGGMKRLIEVDVER